MASEVRKKAKQASVVSQNSSQEGILFPVAELQVQGIRLHPLPGCPSTLCGPLRSWNARRWSQPWCEQTHHLPQQGEPGAPGAHWVTRCNTSSWNPFCFCAKLRSLCVYSAGGKKVTWLRLMQPASPSPKPWWPITRRHYHLVCPASASGFLCHWKSKRFGGPLPALAVKNPSGKPTKRNGARLYIKQWLWDFNVRKKSGGLFQVKMIWIHTSIFLPPKTPRKCNRIYLISHSTSVGKTVEEMTATKFWKLESRWVCDNCFSISQETQIPSWQQGKFKINMICTTASKGSEIGNTRKIGNRMWGKPFEKQVLPPV